MKRVLLCAVLAGACSSRAGGLPDFDSGAPPGDRPRADAPVKGVDVPVGFDVGSPDDVPPAVDAGSPEDVPVVVDVPAPTDLGPACGSDRECSAAGLVCDRSRGVCVECVRAEDCLDAGQACASNRCVAGFDGGPPADRGVPPTDRGVPPTDRGVPPTDRGVPPTDRGVPPDVGPSVPLLNGYGGPNGFGPLTHCLGPSDDGSFASTADGGAGTSPTPVPLGSGFGAGLLMAGRRYTSFYLNNNGNLSFGAALTTYTANPFPRAVTSPPVPLIAPWWADVDTRGGGQPATNHVCFAMEPGRLVATWHKVGYFNSRSDRLNSFQVIVTPVGTAGDFDVEFRYTHCQWTTGDASGGMGGLGGTPAQAGVDLGDGVNFLTLPGSRTAGVIDLCRTSSGSTPGLWRMQVRSGVVRLAG